MKQRILFALAAFSAAAFLTVSAQAKDLTGAGSTFAYPIYAKWADSYQKEKSIGLNYQSIGSGGGIKQIEAKTVDFGASDMPLSHEALAAAGLVQFPTCMGGVMMVVNLPGIKPGELTLDGPTLAKIYLGKITNWNDPAIVKLNPGVKLPATAMAVVHRSDGSGTTFIFTNYLSKMSPEWQNKVGVDVAVDWPVGLGGKGSEGVSALASETVGGIGYVEYAYALQNKLTYTKQINQAGVTVSPNMKTFSAAAANAEWNKAQDFNLILTNQPGKDSWPITGATFILMQKNPPDPAAALQVLDFFSWAYNNGAGMAESLAYIPMPKNVVPLIETSWKQISASNGKPIWTAMAQ